MPRKGIIIKNIVLLLGVTVFLIGCGYSKTKQENAIGILGEETLSEMQIAQEEVNSSLTMEKLIELCNSETWNEDVDKYGLSLFTKYTNVVAEEIDNEESLTSLYRCEIPFKLRNYELQIYYWLPETAKEYGYKENEIDTISLTERTSGDGQLLYIRPKETRFKPNSDISSFLLKKYDLAQYIKYVIPKGEVISEYQTNIVSGFDGYLFREEITDAYGDFVPQAWRTTGGLGIANNEEIKLTFSDKEISSVEGILGNHMEVISEGESYRTSDFSAYLIEIEFDLFTASEVDDYETSTQAKLTDCEKTSRYYYAYLGNEGQEEKYVAFLNADKYTKEDLKKFVSTISPITVKTADGIEDENIFNNFQVENPSWEYYIANETFAQATPLKLTKIAETENNITDMDRWFQNNQLSKSFNEDNYYRYEIERGYILSVYKKQDESLLFRFDFSQFEYAYDFKETDKAYAQQSIQYAKIIDYVLYVSISHMTYAETSPHHGYIIAIDLADGKVIWKTEPLVSNAFNFQIIGDVILSGYGFTEEDDYLYQLDKNTGKIIDKTPLKSKADYIFGVGVQ